MDRKSDIIAGLKEFKENLSKDISVDKMIFFGSRVQGGHYKDSDIDLILVSPKFADQKFYKRPVKLYDYWNLDYPVDFLCYTPKEFRKMSNQVTIVREAVRTGVEI